MLPPAVQVAVDSLPLGPVKLLITGGIGSGKSTALAAVRSAMHESGARALTRLPHLVEPAPTGIAVVIDDAHLLTGEELRQLTEFAGQPDTTVIVAAESRNQNAALRELVTAIERHRPRVILGPLTNDQMSGLGAVMSETAGIPFLAHAAMSENPGAAFFALIERLRRLDEPDLAALLIASLDSDLGAADIAAALGISSDEGLALIDHARGTGLIEPSHDPRFLKSVHRAVGQIVGNARHHDIESALLRTQLEMATLSPRLAVRLAAHGMRNPQLADSLRQQALSSRTAPAANTRLFQAAVDAGAAELRSQLGDALALSGDCSAAAALADDLLSSADSAERAAAVRIAASLAANDGNFMQAAELFAWLGPYPDTAVAAAAAIVLTGTGDIGGARSAIAARDPAPPTAAARAARNLTEGLLLTVEACYPAAAAKLGQAMAAESAVNAALHTVLPDSISAIVTLAALHNGDQVRAHSVINRAVGDPTPILFESRHRLLSAWAKMQDGQLAAAAHEVSDMPLAELPRRDALWLAALRTAIARRTGDFGAVQKHWSVAVDMLAEYSIDLYSLLPVGELWISAARIGQPNRLAAIVGQAFLVLRSLGDPVAWSLPLHWAGVHAGIISNNPALVAPHGQALAAAATGDPFAKVLATAGRAWLRVLAKQVDADEVTSAARGLAEFGLTADATRLAGQAALQASDSKVSGFMLQVARELKLARPDSGDIGAEPTTEAAMTATGSTRSLRAALSDRERQVAELLLLGMPYRDIGSQLFISAKTVEHHVARIRRRLGAESRSEMLSMLRAILAPPD